MLTDLNGDDGLKLPLILLFAGLFISLVGCTTGNKSVERMDEKK